MKLFEEQVLESDQIHAKNCWEGYIFYKHREPELANYYWDTLHDLVERKQIMDELNKEEQLLVNAIWMIENGSLSHLSLLKLVDVLNKATLRLKLIRQKKAIVSGNLGDLMQTL